MATELIGATPITGQLGDEVKSLKAGEPGPVLLRDLERIDATIAAMLADGKKLLDRAHLLSRIRDIGIAFNTWQALDGYQDWTNASRAGILQTPTELADFLLYVARTEPADMVEIGTFTGGTMLIAAAMFQALKPDFHYYGIDPKARTLALPRTLERLNLTEWSPATSDDHAGRAFDVVFIDGDHSYDWAKRDYLNLGRHARKICAFHDINAQQYTPARGGVFRFWRQLRHSVAQEAKVVEICHSPPPREGEGDFQGIGLIDRS